MDCGNNDNENRTKDLCLKFSYRYSPSDEID